MESKEAPHITLFEQFAIEMVEEAFALSAWKGTDEHVNGLTNWSCFVKIFFKYVADVSGF